MTKSEIKFDAEARRKHLTGFSKRKQSRRLYGLAMQKVKDRKSKLQKRQELREAEQLQQEEHAKKQASIQEQQEETVQKDTQVYQDVQTQSQFGGQVVVRITNQIPDDEDDALPPIERSKKTDEAQEYAGSVERYMKDLQRQQPKKKSRQGTKRKGQHGALNGNASDWKTATKLLSKSAKSKSKRPRKK